MTSWHGHAKLEMKSCIVVYLIVRSRARHVALTRRLRQVGHDLSADSLFGAAVVERAIHTAYISLLRYLLLPHQPPPAWFLAASTGDTPELASVVRYLPCGGIDIHAVSVGRRDTALHLAALYPWEPRSLELTSMLIKLDVTLGETPLGILLIRYRNLPGG